MNSLNIIGCIMLATPFIALFIVSLMLFGIKFLLVWLFAIFVIMWVSIAKSFMEYK